MGGREDTIRIYTSQSYTKTKKAYQFMFIALGLITKKIPLLT